MKTRSNDNSSAPATSGRIAKPVLALIVSVQAKIAASCSRRFNSYTAYKQKLVLLGVAAFTSAILLAGLLTNTYTIPALHQSYKPATHIGMASDINHAGIPGARFTDSLTKK